jgi:hypothetical protein
MATKKSNKLPPWATTVTPFSKMLALFMFILLPIVGFYYGRYYQKQLDRYQMKPPVINYIINPAPTTAHPQNDKISCKTNGDCPSGYSCAQPGPIVANGTPHRYCWKNGTAIPL